MGQYEEDKELWVASMASIIAAARLGGRIFTADENNSLMLLYMPGKSASGIEASKHTPEHKRFVELAQNKYPQHAQWVTQDVCPPASSSDWTKSETFQSKQSDTVLAATTNKSWPGSSPADSIHVQFLGTKVGHQGKGSGRALLRAAQTIADEEKVPCAIEASLPVVRSARVAVVEGLLADDRRHHSFRM